ncbi:hypothetical protein [Paraburkholderia sp. DGU8]|uniref:hypothetical protein n=1 Tax=Paraburkholderia sp. DGU8 TaxID=3161997 RepID=UPI003465526A
MERQVEAMVAAELPCGYLGFAKVRSTGLRLKVDPAALYRAETGVDRTLTGWYAKDGADEVVLTVRGELIVRAACDSRSDSTGPKLGWMLDENATLYLFAVKEGADSKKEVAALEEIDNRIADLLRAILAKEAVGNVRWLDFMEPII